MTTPVTFRSATPGDVEQLIDLMLVSSWGGIRTAWERACGPNQTWRAKGLSELADRDCEIGYAHFVVADAGGRIAAMVLLNLIGNTDSIDPRHAPPQEAGPLALIRLARHSLFIREIATADWARGRGLASELIEVAERVAAREGTDRLTLFVNDSNAPAERLYRKLGFATIAEEASLGHPRFPDGSRLMLMQKAVVPAPKKKEAPESAS